MTRANVIEQTASNPDSYADQTALVEDRRGAVYAPVNVTGGCNPPLRFQPAGVDSNVQNVSAVGTNPAQAQLIRPRRLRAHSALRSMVQETHLRLDSLIMPYFIIEGTKRKLAIDPMPGIFQMSVDQALFEIEKQQHQA